MKLFCRQSFCSECGVAFEPRRDAYDYLCLPHAKPKLDTDRRRNSVVLWAGANWERLEVQKKKEDAERAAQYAPSQEFLQRQAEAMRPMPQQQMSGYGNLDFLGSAAASIFGKNKL